MQLEAARNPQLLEVLKTNPELMLLPGDQVGWERSGPAGVENSLAVHLVIFNQKKESVSR